MPGSLSPTRYGALGMIHQIDTRGRSTWMARFATLMAIVGPGLIVMIGGNDGGAFGTALMWTLLLLVPVLYVKRGMIIRLGTVAGVGHARLFLERFGKVWGALSVINLALSYSGVREARASRSGSSSVRPARVIFGGSSGSLLGYASPACCSCQCS